MTDSQRESQSGFVSATVGAVFQRQHPAVAFSDPPAECEADTYRGHALTEKIRGSLESFRVLGELAKFFDRGLDPVEETGIYVFHAIVIFDERPLSVCVNRFGIKQYSCWSDLCHTNDKRPRYYL
jgi:hypothetical protein